MKVSIIFRTYNRYTYTKWALETLREYTNWNLVNEFFVGDAGSTDGTQNLCKQYVHKFNEKGFNGSWELYDAPLKNVALNLRLGVEKAKSEYIVVCDNDVLYAPNWLDRAVKAAEIGRKFEYWIISYQMPSTNIARVGPPILINEKDKLVPVAHVGGLVIAPRDLLLSENAFGHLGDHNQQFFGWWDWQQGYKEHCAAIRPDSGCYPMEYGYHVPHRYKYAEARTKEPLVRMALAENLEELKLEYLQKGWMRWIPI